MSYIYFLECSDVVSAEARSLVEKKHIETARKGYFAGDSVDFTCNGNYVISDVGKSTAECLENGNWNVTFPSCYKSNFSVLRVKTCF